MTCDCPTMALHVWFCLIALSIMIGTLSSVEKPLGKRENIEETEILPCVEKLGQYMYRIHHMPCIRCGDRWAILYTVVSYIVYRDGRHTMHNTLLEDPVVCMGEASTQKDPPLHHIIEYRESSR